MTLKQRQSRGQSKLLSEARSSESRRSSRSAHCVKLGKRSPEQVQLHSVSYAEIQPEIHGPGTGGCHEDSRLSLERGNQGILTLSLAHVHSLGNGMQWQSGRGTRTPCPIGSTSGCTGRRFSHSWRNCAGHHDGTPRVTAVRDRHSSRQTPAASKILGKFSAIGGVLNPVENGNRENQ